MNKAYLKTCCCAQSKAPKFLKANKEAIYFKVHIDNISQSANFLLRKYKQHCTVYVYIMIAICKKVCNKVFFLRNMIEAQHECDFFLLLIYVENLLEKLMCTTVFKTHMHKYIVLKFCTLSTAFLKIMWTTNPTYTTKKNTSFSVHITHTAYWGRINHSHFNRVHKTS